MALYAGETVRFSSVARDFDQNLLTDDDVTEAFVEIFDGDGVLQGAAHDLTWDALRAYWYYDWPAEAGTFKFKVTFRGLAYETKEIATIRVKADPLGA